jgi:hypothetical protein
LVEASAMFLAHLSGVQDEPENRPSWNWAQLRRKKHVDGFRRTQHHWPFPIYICCVLVRAKSTASFVAWFGNLHVCCIALKHWMWCSWNRKSLYNNAPRVIFVV